MVRIAPSSPASTDSDTKSVRKMRLRLPPKRGQVKVRFSVLLVRAASSPVWTPKWNFRRAVKAQTHLLLGETEIFPERQPIESTDLIRKRFFGILRSEEQLEQSEEQQEDQPQPGQADSLMSQGEASPLSPPRPPLSLPLPSEARPSSFPVSHPSQGTSDQMQDTPDWAPELSFPACLPKTVNLLEEERLEGHDQLYDSAVRHLISGIDCIGEFKRCYDLRAGEQASRLKETEDTAIMLRKQVEELEAKVSMANISEHCLRNMLSISEDRHAGTKRELALMQEKMDEANLRIEHLESAVSRYQNRIAVAEAEKEKAEERACGASIGVETMSTPRPSPVAPRSTFLSFVPSPGPCLTDLEVCKESALFPELTYY